MRFLKFAAIALLLATVFFLPAKRITIIRTLLPLPVPVFEGKWVGKYGFGNDAPAIFYSFKIKPANVIEELDQAGVAIGTGTWILTGTNFTAHYQWPGSVIFGVSATYNSTTGKLNGTWGYGDNATNGGKWEQSKQ